jgi:hypothetical protein
MFTIYRDCGRVPLGQSESILGVLRFAEATGVGRYDVHEAGIRPRYWGSIVRNQDGRSSSCRSARPIGRAPWNRPSDPREPPDRIGHVRPSHLT